MTNNTTKVLAKMAPQTNCGMFMGCWVESKDGIWIYGIPKYENDRFYIVCTSPKNGREYTVECIENTCIQIDKYFNKN